LLGAIGRRWPLAVGLGLVCALAVAAAAWHFLTPKYTAFAKIQVRYTRQSLSGTRQTDEEGRTEFDTYKRRQATALTGRFVLNDALKKPEIQRLRLVQAQPEPLLWLEDELKVQMKEASEEVILTLAGGSDPDELVTLVRAIVQSFLGKVVKKEEEDRKAYAHQVTLAYNDAKEKLTRLRNTLTQRLKQSGGGEQALRERQLMTQGELTEVKRQHSQVDSDLSQAQNRLKDYKSREHLPDKVTVPAGVVEAALDANGQVNKYREQIAQIQSWLDTHGPNFVNPNDTVLTQRRKFKADLQKRIEVLRRRLEKGLLERHRKAAREEYETALAQLEAAIGPLTEREKQLREKVERLAREVSSMSLSSSELDQLRDDVRQQDLFVETFASRSNLLEVDVKSGPRVTLLQDAGLQKVDTKKRLMATILGPIVAFAGVCLAVGWLEFRARRVRSTDEVAGALGMRVVGAVPALPGPALGRLLATSDAQDEYEANLLESIDAIRTMLLRDASVAATRVVMVTSAVAGEGKTTLASNLATSLARAGRKTLLLDCDLRCPAAHQLFEQTLQPGLSEVLLGEVDLVDAVRPTTAIEGLWLIPAGEWDREVVQELAKETIKDVFDRLRDEFDFIVVDSHPVLPATDSLLIGQHVDAVLLALMRDVSQLPRVHTAAQRLTNLGIRVLGAVVNGMPSEVYENGYLTPALASG
jgi:capsular exopolysaccharide synthesis family protein